MALFIGTLGTTVHTCSSLSGIVKSNSAQIQLQPRRIFDNDGGLSIQSIGDDNTAVAVNFDFLPRSNAKILSIPILNRSWAPMIGTATLRGPSGSGNFGFSLDPGWNVIVVDRLAAGSTLRWPEMRQVSLYLNAPNQQPALDRSGGLFPVEVDSININPTGPAVFTCSWDDGHKSVLDHGWPVIQQFPRIRHTLNLVKTWVESGTRVGLDSVQTLRKSDLDFLWRTGRFKFGNHSDRHLRYESGIDPEFTGTTAGSQVLGIRSGTGRFRIRIGSRWTLPLRSNENQRTVEAELAKIVGVGNVSVRTTGSSTLDRSFGFRVEFRTAQPLMAVQTFEGDVQAYAGPAIRFDKITQAYTRNREFLVLNGWVSSDIDTVAYPEGSFGPNVRIAMTQAGVRYGRIMSRKSGQSSMVHPFFAIDPYQVPALNVSAAGVTATIAAIDQCMAVGGHLNLMFHDVNRTGLTQGNTINQNDLRTILSYLNSRIDLGAKVMTQGEYADWYRTSATAPPPPAQP